MKDAPPIGILKGARLSFVIALAMAVVSLPLLALYAQSGDGAELVRLSVQGGVPHPPGFPLQAWLMRLFSFLPFPQAATRVAFLCLLGHAFMVFAISESLRHLKVGVESRVLAAVAAGIFAPMWALAVQPEVFALAYALEALILMYVCFLAKDPASSSNFKSALLVGALVAAAGAQHPITIVAAPAFCVGAVLVLQKSDGRWPRLGLMALVFGILFVGAYASLPALRTDSYWPDWGRLEFKASAIWGHALRAEYGTFSLAVPRDAVAPENQRGIWVFFVEALSQWPLFFLFLLPGLLALWKRKRPEQMALLGTFFLALLFLARAEMSHRDFVAHAVLERFTGTAAIPAALIAGLGIDHVMRLVRQQRIRWGLAALLGVTLAWQGFVNLPRVDASWDETTHIFRRAIGSQLSDDAIYVGGDDLQTFAGAILPNGQVRNTIAAGLLGLDWYATEVVPLVDPRVKPLVAQPNHTGPLLKAAMKSGIPVMSTAKALVSGPENLPELRGLLHVLDPRVDTEIGSATVTAARALCPFVLELESLPQEGHATSRTIYTRFARAFDAAAHYLEAVGEVKEAKKYAAVARALEALRPAQTWRQACMALANPPGARSDGQAPRPVSDQ